MSVLDEVYEGDYVVPAWSHMPELPEIHGKVTRIRKDGRNRVFEIDWDGDLPEKFTQYVTRGMIRGVRRGHIVSAISRVPGDDGIYALYLEDICGGIAPKEPSWDEAGMGSLSWAAHWSLYTAYHKGYTRAEEES